MTYTATTKEIELTRGTTVMLETAPVDPRDFLSGDYVIVGLQISTVPLNFFQEYKGSQQRIDKLRTAPSTWPCAKPGSSMKPSVPALPNCLPNLVKSSSKAGSPPISGKRTLCASSTESKNILSTKAPARRQGNYESKPPFQKMAMPSSNKST